VVWLLTIPFSRAFFLVFSICFAFTVQAQNFAIVTLEGKTFEQIVDDKNFNATSSIVVKRADDGLTVNLRGSNLPQAGEEVILEGIYVSDYTFRVDRILKSRPPVTLRLAKSVVRSSAAVLINIVEPDGSISENSCTRFDQNSSTQGREHAAHLMFSSEHSVQNTIREVSGGNLILSGDASDVEGPILLRRLVDDNGQPYSCRDTAYQNAAISWLRSQGKSNYDHISFIFPETFRDECGFQGIAEVNGDFTRNFECHRDIILHEMGHSLGFRHAATPNLEGNSYQEYGDYTSLMGGTLSTERLDFGPLYSLFAGWIPPTRRVKLDIGGTWNIENYDQRFQSSGVVIAEIESDDNTSLLVAHRSPDSFLLEPNSFRPALTEPIVTVHRVRRQGEGFSAFVGLPGTQSGVHQILEVRNLADLGYYLDPKSENVISLDSVDQGGARIQVLNQNSLPPELSGSLVTSLTAQVDELQIQIDSFESSAESAKTRFELALDTVDREGNLRQFIEHTEELEGITENWISSLNETLNTVRDQIDSGDYSGARVNLESFGISNLEFFHQLFTHKISILKIYSDLLSFSNKADGSLNRIEILSSSNSLIPGGEIERELQNFKTGVSELQREFPLDFSNFQRDVLRIAESFSREQVVEVVVSANRINSKFTLAIQRVERTIDRAVEEVTLLRESCGTSISFSLEATSNNSGIIHYEVDSSRFEGFRIIASPFFDEVLRSFQPVILSVGQGGEFSGSHEISNFEEVAGQNYSLDGEPIEPDIVTAGIVIVAFSDTTGEERRQVILNHPFCSQFYSEVETPTRPDPGGQIGEVELDSDPIPPSSSLTGRCERYSSRSIELFWDSVSRSGGTVYRNGTRLGSNEGPSYYHSSDEAAPDGPYKIVLDDGSTTITATCQSAANQPASNVIEDPVSSEPEVRPEPEPEPSTSTQLQSCEEDRFRLCDLRCETYGSSSGEIMWTDHTEGVEVNGDGAGGTSYYMDGQDFSSPKEFTVTVDGTLVETITCSQEILF